MGNKNWIKEYIHTITGGPLPTMSENSDDVIMQEKIDGVWIENGVKNANKENR